MGMLAAIPVPFSSAEEAWFWAWDELLSLRAGAPRGGRRYPPRLCRPTHMIGIMTDIGLDDRDVAVLAYYGRAGYPPAEGTPDGASWSRLLAVLADQFRMRGWLSDGSVA